MASYGPGNEIEKSSQELIKSEWAYKASNSEEQQPKIICDARTFLHRSFSKFIEPVIEPLGYDWKIGISLISSFAARGVFTSGSLSTIYAVYDEREEKQNLSFFM